MNNLYEADIPKEAYRIWFMMNSKTSICVKTPTGLTEYREAGELCGQGSAGASLASQLDIDMGIKSYFSSSTDEIKYGRVRVQPQAFQEIGRAFV